MLDSKTNPAHICNERGLRKKVRGQGNNFFGSSVIILIIMMLFIMGWAENSQPGDAKMKGNPDVIILTDNDHGREVPLTISGILTLKLECSPGTGYSWEIVRNNRNLLELQGEPRFEAIKSGVLGGIEYQIFHFKALVAGTNILELSYTRKWENKPPLKTYRVTLLIR